MNCEPVAILYVGESDLPKFFSKGSEWKVQQVKTPRDRALVDIRPDILIMDPSSSEEGLDLSTAGQWLKKFDPEGFRVKPGIFCLADPKIGEQEILALLELGYDQVLFRPLSARVVQLYARSFVERIQIAQQQQADSKSLTKSFEYLDRFKEELKDLKTELIEEKTSLNAALKQIQEMTGERRRLKQTLAEHKETLKANMEGFGMILTSLIKTRVEINRGHGEQVAKIAKFMGRDLGMDENQLEDLSKAAMLHEIGLLFMSQGPHTDKKTREQNSSLSEYDKTLMTQYPVKGAELLNHCPGFETAALIIRSMNEWADGTGYPEGLKRRYISMGSKILAGADELENLKFRPEIEGPKQMLTALEQMAGSRLDPVIVGLLGKYVVTQMNPESFRVRGVGIEQLEPGMRLGTAIFTATGTKLFSSDTELTREAIDKIIQYNREYPVDETVYIKV